MHRAALAVSVWAILVTIVALLAAAAKPDAGPPMPARIETRDVASAIVPERDVTKPAPHLSPDDLTGTKSGAVKPMSAHDPRTVEPNHATPAAAPTPEVHGAKNSEKTADSHAVSPDTTKADARAKIAEARQDARGEGTIPGLGPLPKGVPAEEEGLGLHVERADGRSASDVQVRWILASGIARLRAADPNVEALDDEDLLARSDLKARTNGVGFALLSSEKGTMIVDARSGDLYASARIRREDTSHVRLVLQRDSTLSITTVDSTGAPFTDVPIVMRDAHCKTLWSARTAGADARLVIRHADGFLAKTKNATRAVTLALDVPGVASAPISLACGAVPTEPLRFTLDRGGRVSVHVADVGGHPCTEAAEVALMPAGAARDCEHARTRVSRDGIAQFECVPLGARWTATVDGGCGPVPISNTFDGPKSADQTVDVVLRHAAPMPTVKGRLVDANAQILAGWRVDAWLAVADGWRAESSTHVAPDGSFAIAVPHWYGATTPLTLALVARNEYGRTKALTRELASPAPNAPLDLGNARVDEWPIIAGGTIIDEKNRAVPEAFVEIVDASGVPDPRTRINADDNAHFDLRAPPATSERVKLRITEPLEELASTDQEVSARDRKLRPVLPLSGVVAGRVILSPGADNSAIQMRMEEPSGAWLALSVGEDGAFRFDQVEPGACRLKFTTQGFSENVLNELDVTVVRGGTASVGDVDLRTKLTLMELALVDDHDKPVLTATIGPESNGRPHGRPIGSEDGIVHVLVPVALEKFIVTSDSFDPVTITRAEGRARVQLLPIDR